MENIILIGAPGSGKGTQAEMIANIKRNYIHFSTGNLIRNNIQNNTPNGIRCKKYDEAGMLVPNHLMIKMTEDFIEQLKKEQPTANIVWDGFPRTILQAKALDKLLKHLQQKIKCVIYLKIQKSKLLTRVVGRLTCNVCNRTYHAVNLPPKELGICDYCKSSLSSRSDDSESKFNIRYQVYIENTKPLLAYYEERQLLHTIEADQKNETVKQQIWNIINGSY